jgi:uncharacterized PurR-regulated membrane protein YhhQ (DUF165 family)
MPGFLTALIGVFEIAIVLYVVRLMPDRKTRALGALVLVNMVLISTTGAKMVQIWGGTTNMGNTLYAGVVLAQVVMLERKGRDLALQNLSVVAVAMIGFMVLAQLVRYAPALPPTADGLAIDVVLAASATTAYASLMGFAFAQYMLILLYDAFGRWGVVSRYLTASASVQAVDSAIFFSTTFNQALDARRLLESVAIGFAIKMVFALASVPVVLYAARAGRLHVKTPRGLKHRSA